LSRSPQSIATPCEQDQVRNATKVMHTSFMAMLPAGWSSLGSAGIPMSLPASSFSTKTSSLLWSAMAPAWQSRQPLHAITYRPDQARREPDAPWNGPILSLADWRMAEKSARIMPYSLSLTRAQNDTTLHHSPGRSTAHEPQPRPPHRRPHPVRPAGG